MIFSARMGLKVPVAYCLMYGSFELLNLLCLELVVLFEFYQHLFCQICLLGVFAIKDKILICLVDMVFFRLIIIFVHKRCSLPILKSQDVSLNFH